MSRLLKVYSIFLFAMLSIACDSSRDGNQSAGQSTSAYDVQKLNNALKSAGAMLPEGKYSVDEKAAQSNEESARRLAGDRGVFGDMHDKQGITLLPAKTALSLNPETVDQAVPFIDDGACPAEEAKKVCASACATATASAYAYAFAHASATACAWAQAWACVFTFRPFNQVCSWASSQACVTSFSSAFSAAFVTDTQTVCDTQCSK